MKNRKIVVASFLLIAVLLMGIGYAAVSDTLNFDGDAVINGEQVQHEFDIDVKITAVADDDMVWVEYASSSVEINKADDLIVNIIDDTADNVQDSAKFQIYSLSDAGDEQVIWFKVENESAHVATLNPSLVTEQGTGDYFTAEYKIYETDGTTETLELPAKDGDVNGEVWVKLTVTLKNTPSEAYSASFSFSIGANA